MSQLVACPHSTACGALLIRQVATKRRCLCERFVTGNDLTAEGFERS